MQPILRRKQKGFATAHSFLDGASAPHPHRKIQAQAKSTGLHVKSKSGSSREKQGEEHNNQICNEFHSKHGEARQNASMGCLSGFDVPMRTKPHPTNRKSKRARAAF